MNKNMNSDVNKHIELLIDRYPDLRNSAEKILYLYNTIKIVFCKRKTLFCCGNGGSCADSDHFVGELCKNFRVNRGIPDALKKNLETMFPGEHLEDRLQGGFRAMTLNGLPALTTAYMNDVDPLMTYAQQLLVYGSEGDALVGFSTSGNAKNICNAFKVAKAMGITTILMTGSNERGLCRPFADVVMDVPASEPYLVQELHLPIYHALAIMLEEEFYG